MMVLFENHDHQVLIEYADLVLIEHMDQKMKTRLEHFSTIDYVESKE